MLRKILDTLRRFIKLILNRREGEIGDNKPDLVRAKFNYFPKNFLTTYEKEFYKKLELLNDNYVIIPQVNLAAIIDKVASNNKFTYRSELFRNVDFGIFSKDFELLLLIEIDDKSHNTKKRRYRDIKVRNILDECGIKLIHFYTNKPNEKEYVIKRILDTIKSN